MDFNEIYLRYHRMIRSIAYRFGFHDETADDLVQDVALRIMEKASTLQHQEAMTVWVKNLTVNYCINCCNSEGHRRKRQVEFDETMTHLPDPARLDADHHYVLFIREDGQSEYVQWDHLVRDVPKIIELVSNPDQKQVAHRWFVEGQSIQEISAALAMPEGTVSSHVHRFKKVADRAFKRLYGEVAK